MKEPAQDNSDIIEELEARIHALIEENRLLKERMDEVGVSYADIVHNNGEDIAELYDPDQGARIKKFEITDKVASNFFMMFCRGRKDVYDLRYTNPKTGKNRKGRKREVRSLSVYLTSSSIREGMIPS